MVYFACFDRKLLLIDITLKSISGMRHRRFTLAQKTRSPIDRRSGSDRRNAYHLGYFMNGGEERRSGKERKSVMDRRKAGAMSGDGASEQIEGKLRAKKAPK